MERDEEIILPLNIMPSFDEFLGLLSVTKNGLAAQLFEPVYRQLFVHSEDIKDEYIRYYSIEYPTLSDYLEIYHNEKLSEEDMDKQYILKFKNKCELTHPAYQTDYLERIIDLLRKHGEKEDEN